VNRHAFSGGGATVEEHRARGANLDVDVPWKYLNFFLDDDEKLAEIGREYSAGRMLTGEVRPTLYTVHNGRKLHVPVFRLDLFFSFTLFSFSMSFSDRYASFSYLYYHILSYK
jgi:hypothetical protein